MVLFKYKARDKFGKLTTGVIEADNSGAAGSQLKRTGYTPVSIEAEGGEAELSKFLRRFQKVKFADLNMFTRQLVTLQRAGLPLLSSLRALRDQTNSKILKTTLDFVVRDIEGGLSFSDALAKHSGVFNPLYVSMIEAGETGGMLDEVLDRLATLGEHEEETQTKIKVATRYPIMVIAALGIAFLILTTFVIPRFTNLYSQFDVSLPLPTRVLLWINYALTKFWWLAGIVISFFIFAFNKFTKTDFGRLWWDNLKLKVPIFGPLFVKLTMSRFARITGTLIKSGVPILQILELASKGVGNIIIARAINSIRTNINEGKGMSEPMRISGMFPPIVVQMVSAGEATGKIDELLLHVSDYYDSQADFTIKNLATLIEPVLIFVLGCGVLFMALGIFLPMWNLMSLFRG